MSRILITGGCGYIGSHIVLLLIQKGYEVIILDSNINSSSKVLKKIKKILELNNYHFSNNLKFFKGDIRDQKVLEKIFLNAYKKDHKIDGVIHLSGLKSISESKTIPLDYWDVNISGTINLLRVMDKFECNKLIYSSSASIYGNSEKFPFHEDSPSNTLNPYANTKLTGEIFLKDLCDIKSTKWNIICLRYFNPIGAHKSGLLGEEPIYQTNNIFPLILNSCLDSKKKIYIYGQDWPTPDGTCIRDYIHIEDLAEGHIAALTSLLKEHRGFIRINLGTGHGTSVLELLKVFEKVNNIKLSYEFTSRREGDCPVLVADNLRALSYLSWHPKRDLEKMCLDGYNWLKTN